MSNNNKGVSTPLANSLSEMESCKARYDNHAKELLADPQVLTRILKGTIEEFKDMSLEDIGQAISGTIEIGTSRRRNNNSLPSMAVDLKNQENFLPGEGKIVFDIKCRATIPDELIDIIINVEAQKDTRESTLGYPLDKRIIYYLSRLISEQKDKYFFNSEYGKIKKVTSIWICMDTESDRDAINEICLTQKSIFGKPLELNNLDLMRAYVISIRKDENLEKSRNTLIAMLEDLFSSKDSEIKKKKLVDEHQMIMTMELERSVAGMCNLSDVVWEQGKAEGLAEGKAEGKAEGISLGKLEVLVQLAKTGKLSVSDAAACAGMGVEEFIKLMEE